MPENSPSRLHNISWQQWELTKFLMCSQEPKGKSSTAKKNTKANFTCAWSYFWLKMQGSTPTELAIQLHNAFVGKELTLLSEKYVLGKFRFI